jgi:hypothetical protein
MGLHGLRIAARACRLLQRSRDREVNVVAFRFGVFGLIGLGFVALLAWLTNWPYALYCHGALMAGMGAHQASSASPLDVPLWMSAGGGRLFLTLVKLVSLLSPLVLGLVWFRWWWGFAGYACGAVGAGLTFPILPMIVRLIGGLLLSVVTLVLILA